MTLETPSRKRMFGGHYELVKELGHGGMGVVYLAKDLEKDRMVAIKELVSSKAYRQANLLRFKREIRALQQMRHTNVVDILDAAISEEEHFYVMEFIEGADLLQFYKKFHPDLEEHARHKHFLGLATQITDALGYIHSFQYVHRDLKPENILVKPEGIVKLMDFGLARKIQSTTAITMEGSILGTVRYMSPEQIQGGNVDHRSDLYALGVMIFEQFTGTFPFNHKNQLNVMMDHVRTPPPVPIELNDAIPKRVSDMILRLLEKDPVKRFQSAAELKTEIQDILKQEYSDAPGGSEGRRSRATDTIDSYLMDPDPTPPSLFAPSLAGQTMQREMAETYFQDLAKQQGVGFCVVQGPPGIGKSFFAQTMAQRLKMNGYLSLVATPTTPFSPFCSLTRAIKQIMEEFENNPQDLLVLLGDNGRCLTGIVPNFEQYAVYSLLPALPDYSEQQMRTLAFETLQRLFLKLAQKQPVLLAIDSLNDADPATVSLMNRLISTPTLPANPVPTFGVILTSHDSDDLTPSQRALLKLLIDSPKTLVFNLDPLDVQDVRAMICSMLGTTDLPDPLVDELFRDCGGVPMILQETLELLLEKKILVRGPFVWMFRVDQYHQLDLKNRFENLLQQKLSTLTDEQLHVLEAASVLGEFVKFESLQALTALEEEILFDQLQVIVRNGLLEEWEKSPGWYRFRHDTVRDSVYVGLEDGLKKQYHAFAAHLMLQGKGPTTPEERFDLARHFRGAGDFHRAYKLFVAAGMAFVQAYQYNRASICLRMADEIELDLSPGDADDLSAISHQKTSVKAKVLEKQGYFQQAAQLLEQLIPYYADREYEQAQVWRAKAMNLAMLDYYDEAIDNCERSLSILKSVQDNMGLSESLVTLGYLMSLRNFGTKALPLLQKTLGTFQRAQAQPQVAFCQGVLGMAYFAMGNFDKALEYYKQSEALFEHLGVLDDWAWVRCLMGEVLVRLGKLDEAQTHFEESMYRCEEIGFLAQLPLATAGLGLVHFSRLQLPSAEAYLRQTIERDEQQGRRTLLAQHLTRHALCHQLQGRYLKAGEEFQRAGALFEGMQLDTFSRSLRMHGVANALHDGRYEEVYTTAQAAITVFDKVGYAPGQCLARFTVGEALMLCGEGAEAVEHLIQAAGIADQRSLHLHQIEVRYHLCRAYHWLGEANNFSLRIQELIQLERHLKDYALLGIWVKELQAMSAYALGQFESAQSQFRNLLKIAAGYTLRPMEMRCLLSLAKCAIKLGDADLSTRSLKSAEKLSEDLHNIDLRWQLHALEARNAQVAGDLDAARARLQRSQEQVRIILGAIGEERLRRGVLNRVARLMEV